MSEKMGGKIKPQAKSMYKSYPRQKVPQKGSISIATIACPLPMPISSPTSAYKRKSLPINFLIQIDPLNLFFCVFLWCFFRVFKNILIS